MRERERECGCVCEREREMAWFVEGAAFFVYRRMAATGVNGTWIGYVKGGGGSRIHT